MELIVIIFLLVSLPIIIYYVKISTIKSELKSYLKNMDNMISFINIAIKKENINEVFAAYISGSYNCIASLSDMYIPKYKVDLYKKLKVISLINEHYKKLEAQKELVEKLDKEFSLMERIDIF